MTAVPRETLPALTDAQRLSWLLARLDGLAMDLLAAGPCDGHIMSPVTREDLDAAILLVGNVGTVDQPHRTYRCICGHADEIDDPTGICGRCKYGTWSTEKAKEEAMLPNGRGTVQAIL